MSMLSGEVSNLAKGEVQSERSLVFMAVVQQRNPMVKKGTDVHVFF